MTFTNAPIVEVSGQCEICLRAVTKKLLKPVARKMKHMVCGSDNCKREFNRRQQHKYLVRRRA